MQETSGARFIAWIQITLLRQKNLRGRATTICVNGLRADEKEFAISAYTGGGAQSGLNLAPFHISATSPLAPRRSGHHRTGWTEKAGAPSACHFPENRRFPWRSSESRCDAIQEKPGADGVRPAPSIASDCPARWSADACCCAIAMRLSSPVPPQFDPRSGVDLARPSRKIIARRLVRRALSRYLTTPLRLCHNDATRGETGNQFSLTHAVPGTAGRAKSKSHQLNQSFPI
jgi:hypothetical protein